MLGALRVRSAALATPGRSLPRRAFHVGTAVRCAAPRRVAALASGSRAVHGVAFPRSSLTGVLGGTGVVGGVAAGVFFSSSSACAAEPDIKAGTRVLVLAGPSGVGKGTLISKLMAEFPGMYSFSVSHTTRAPRKGEQNGVDYHFADKASMEAAIANGEFVEHALVHGTYYGTSKKAIAEAGAAGICILDIDVQGCESLRKLSWSKPSPLFVFILPPGKTTDERLRVLEGRLRSRGTEDEAKIQKRLVTAMKELAFESSPDAKRVLDISIVNDDLEAAYATLKRCVADALA